MISNFVLKEWQDTVYNLIYHYLKKGNLAIAKDNVLDTIIDLLPETVYVLVITMIFIF